MGKKTEVKRASMPLSIDSKILEISKQVAGNHEEVSDVDDDVLGTINEVV